MVGENLKCRECGRVGCVEEQEQDGEKIVVCKCGGDRFIDVEFEVERLEDV